jgi:putative hydrolase of the HAD superfamily
VPLALFDLDDTLVDRAAAYLAWVHEFVAERAVDDAAVAWMVEVDDLGRTDRLVWATAVCERFGIDGDPAELRLGWHQEYLRHYRIDPATVDGLRRLRESGWSIGIVTNGPVGQEEKIHRNGLPALVDGWAVSDLVGARKPELAVFEAAARACGGALDGGWMVGDSAPADMAGGRAAGLGTIWMRCGRNWRDAATEADPWAAQQGLVSEPLPDGWAPDHEVDDIPAAVEIILTGSRAT